MYPVVWLNIQRFLVQFCVCGRSPVTMELVPAVQEGAHYVCRLCGNGYPESYLLDVLKHSTDDSSQPWDNSPAERVHHGRDALFLSEGAGDKGRERRQAVLNHGSGAVTESDDSAAFVPLCSQG